MEIRPLRWHPFKKTQVTLVNNEHVASVGDALGRSQDRAEPANLVVHFFL
jgi:hypothetical protein